MDAASGGGVESLGRATSRGVAFECPAADEGLSSSPPSSRVPRRIRRRLEEGGARSASPCTAEEIDAKLREADLRRQQFHEWLSSKARPKPRSPSWSSQEEDLAQRIEAKLYAAEQKRLSLLMKAQMRLARLDELRQAAKTSVELRFKKEREKLGSKVESRVQQAEANRMLLMKESIQRRIVAKERTARSLLQRINREKKYKERIRTAICQKRAAAEKKRLGLLEAEQTRARARVMQARRVAKSVCHQREIERRKLKERLDDRLQRAKWQRAEFLRQRGFCQNSSRVNWNKQAEVLSRKLARCWRRFVSSRKTTLALTKAFQVLGINENTVRSMPFEQLARRIESPTALKAVKSLLDRLEYRFLLIKQATSSAPENIDHLLKRVGSPSKRGSSKVVRSRGQTRKGPMEAKRRESQKQSRYPVRVVLCAYMILGHPDAVFNGQGEQDNELAKSAINFLREFELLIKIILDGPQYCRLSLHGVVLDDSQNELPERLSFRSQLLAFDDAWRSYLYQFVVWKVKDARLLEEDLVRAACQLELSMMQTCKMTSDGQNGDLTHDMKAIQKQVSEDQHLIREKVKHLSGDAGIERMESALSDTRSKFFEAKENGDTFATPVAHMSSPLLPSSSSSPVSFGKQSAECGTSSSSVVRSLFVDNVSSASRKNVQADSMKVSKRGPSNDGSIGVENDVIVNEILHEKQSSFVDSFATGNEHGINKAKIREMMEKAFWDGIMESLATEQPDYWRIIKLVEEVKSELTGMAPETWKQEISESIDVDILTQVLESGSLDVDYLGKILEYSLSMLLRLSAPANEDDMRKAHQKLMNELSEDKQNGSFVAAVVKGLRFVLERIQALKMEISKARIQILFPIIKGPAGFDYLQKAFGDRYGSPSDAADKLHLTANWLSTVKNCLNEWDEHVGFISASSPNHYLPPANSLRSGLSIASTASQGVPSAQGLSFSENMFPECKGDKVDVLLRLGLLKLASGITGLNEEALPETLKLNFLRLRAVQGGLQKIIVISTSMLVLRQVLVAANIISKPADIENTISSSVKVLSEILEQNPDVGVVEIVDAIISASPVEKLHDKKELIASVLVKSLQSGDAVFEKVSRAIYLAARVIVFGGSAPSARNLAHAILQRIGASILLDQLVNVVEVLVVVAKVSGEVHRPWYVSLLAD